MTTVLICAVQAPFVIGGAEVLVSELRMHLERRGFRVDVVSVPFKGYPASEIVPQSLAYRLLEVTGSITERVDLVIPTKFPSYLVRHPRKVAWLVHQYREAYDLFGTRWGSLQDTDDDRRVREAIHSMDTAALSECRSIFTISRNVAERLKRYNQLEGEALYPPPQDLGRYRSDGRGDYLLYAGRLDHLKRLDLAIDAMKRVKSAARLKIAGAGPLETEIRKQIEGLDVGGRVELLGFVSRQDLLELYAGCRGVVYVPWNEDYGYVTVEAFFSQKPVITTTDAGGPLEFVSHGESGLVAEPTPEALAAAIDALWESPEGAWRAMGEAGRARVSAISWDTVVDRLTACLS